MNIKKFLHDNYFRLASLVLLVLIIYSPTSISGKIVRYLLSILVFIIYAISLHISLKTEENINIFTRILCKATIILMFVAIINCIYQIYKIII